jgi:hypothetical protein
MMTYVSNSSTINFVTFSRTNRNIVATASKVLQWCCNSTCHQYDHYRHPPLSRLLTFAHWDQPTRCAKCRQNVTLTCQQSLLRSRADNDHTRHRGVAFNVYLSERSQGAARGDNSVHCKLASKISRRSGMKRIVSAAKP